MHLSCKHEQQLASPCRYMGPVAQNAPLGGAGELGSKDADNATARPWVRILEIDLRFILDEIHKMHTLILPETCLEVPGAHGKLYDGNGY